MSETTTVPKWIGPLAAAVLGVGGTGGALEGLDLFGHQATADALHAERLAVETTNAAFLDHITSCETNRTESREVALKLLEEQKQDCREDKAALRDLLQRR